MPNNQLYPLRSPSQAFAARLLMIRAAQQQLDVQYYIWRNDITSSILMSELLQAADRGVRVRVLLDDYGTSGLDSELAALDMHPNIEVRLFNPFAIRRFKALGYLTHFSRANRRMHNKSLSADSAITVIGGRNIGDEYFGAASTLFTDLDVAAWGPIAKSVTDDFERYWNCPCVQNLDSLGIRAGQRAQQKLQQRLEQHLSSNKAQHYREMIEHSEFQSLWKSNQLPLITAHVDMLSDDPAKGLGKATQEQLLLSQLLKLIGHPKQTWELVSPYFVPTAIGTEQFCALAKQGVRVRILTNSLAATNVPAVHADYAKRRKALLEAGVELFELRYRPAVHDVEHEQTNVLDTLGFTLHAKTFSTDNQDIFIGSFNFDPRSAILNTELGFVIESPELANQLVSVFDHDLPHLAYSVRLNEHGKLYWEIDGQKFTTEPDTSWWLRAKVRLLALLPLEWML